MHDGPISRRRFILKAVIATAAILLTTSSSRTMLDAARADDPPAGVLFREGFDDARLFDRGWYDGDAEKFHIARDGTRAGAGCIAFHWKADKTPDFSGTRHLFEPSETVYLRAYIKLSKGWGWTGRGYHPHCMHFMTTENDRWHGPAGSHLTVYVEPWNGRLRLAAQDIQNAKAPHGLTQGPLRGGYNGTMFDSKEELFTDDQWHCVEAMYQLNTLDLKQDKANADGIVRAWFDDKLVIDRTDVILRSTDFPKMKFNQFLLTPYFGPGLLPHEQTLWIDELAVSTKRLGPLAKDPQAAAPQDRRPMRVAAAQAKNRMFDFRLKPAEALAQVDRNLDELEKIVRRAGEAGCDALALPEDTLGLLKWEAGNPEHLQQVLPVAVARMLERLGRAAAKFKMHLVVCNDTIDRQGAVRNTAFLLGRDGKEIGRYHKVNLPLAEQSRTPGDGFPVFETPDLGTVGMLICYDLVFPETTRCLALQGADVVFVSTMGGAAMGDEDTSLAAFRTRAVDNFVWLVVAKRGSGSMIISPKGKVVADSREADGLAIAEIDPFAGRDGGDAFNTQPDLRGRLFRERAPAAYRLLTDPNPPVLAKVQSNVTKEQAIRTMAIGITTGEERFNEAQGLIRNGKTKEAIRLLEQLCEECPTSWIDRAARERLRDLRSPEKQPDKPLPDKASSDLRRVRLQFVGADREIPLAGVQVEVTSGHGQDQKKFGQFETDDKGAIEVHLPQGFYYLHLKSEKELPWLPVEVVWNKRSRGPRPQLNLAVKNTGAEKWLDGKQRDAGYEPPANAGGLSRITYTLLPACELVLRAVDAETGQGLAGAKFYTENALGEDWAHSIENENLGAKPIPDDQADRASANRTDDKGNFRRLVGANANFKYGVAIAPAGYEAVGPDVEVEIDIPWGKRRAELVFKFRRIR